MNRPRTSPAGGEGEELSERTPLVTSAPVPRPGTRAVRIDIEDQSFSGGAGTAGSGGGGGAGGGGVHEERPRTIIGSGDGNENGGGGGGGGGPPQRSTSRGRRRGRASQGPPKLTYSSAKSNFYAFHSPFYTEEKAPLTTRLAALEAAHSSASNHDATCHAVAGRAPGKSAQAAPRGASHKMTRTGRGTTTPPPQPPQATSDPLAAADADAKTGSAVTVEAATEETVTPPQQAGTAPVGEEDGAVAAVASSPLSPGAATTGPTPRRPMSLRERLQAAASAVVARNKEAHYQQQQQLLQEQQQQQHQRGEETSSAAPAAAVPVPLRAVGGALPTASSRLMFARVVAAATAQHRREYGGGGSGASFGEDDDDEGDDDHDEQHHQRHRQGTAAAVTPQPLQQPHEYGNNATTAAASPLSPVGGGGSRLAPPRMLLRADTSAPYDSCSDDRLETESVATSVGTLPAGSDDMNMNGGGGGSGGTFGFFDGDGEHDDMSDEERMMEVVHAMVAAVQPTSTYEDLLWATYGLSREDAALLEEAFRDEIRLRQLAAQAAAHQCSPSPLSASSPTAGNLSFTNNNSQNTLRPQRSNSVLSGGSFRGGTGGAGGDAGGGVGSSRLDRQLRGLGIPVKGADGKGRLAHAAQQDFDKFLQLSREAEHRKAPPRTPAELIRRAQEETALRRQELQRLHRTSSFGSLEASVSDFGGPTDSNASFLSSTSSPTPAPGGGGSAVRSPTWSTAPATFISDWRENADEQRSGDVYAANSSIAQERQRKEAAADDFDPAEMLHEDKYPILAQTLGLVFFAVVAKFVAHQYFKLEGYMDMADVGAVLSGLFFIQGIVFSGVSSDLRTAQGLPQQVVNILEAVEDTFLFASKDVIEAKLRLSYAQDLLVHFGRTWREYIVLQREQTYFHAETILKELVLLAALWDSKKADGMSSVRGSIADLREPMLSAAYICRTRFLPAAHALLVFFVLAATILLMLVNFQNTIVMVCTLASVLTVIWFTLRMIRSMQNPFDICPPRGIRRWVFGYMATVQLFPLNEYIAKLEIRSSEQKRREDIIFTILQRKKSVKAAIAKLEGVLARIRHRGKAAKANTPATAAESHQNHHFHHHPQQEQSQAVQQPQPLPSGGGTGAMLREALKRGGLLGGGGNGNAS